MNQLRNFGKKKMKRFKHSNKEYILTLLIAIILMISAVASSVLLTLRYTELSRKDHANSAADLVDNELSRALNDGYEILELMSKDKNAAVMPGSILQSIEYKAMSAIQLEHHLMKYSGNRYVAYDDGELYLVTTDARLNGSIARLDKQQIVGILESAFEDEYHYAVFDKNTGRFMLSTLQFNSDNYYDCMLELNNTNYVSQLLSSSEEQLRFTAGDGQDYYFVQKLKDSYGLLLVVSEQTLGYIGSSDFVALIPGLGGMALLLAAFIVYTVTLVLRRRRADYMLQRLVGDYRTTTELIALRASFAVFEIERGARGAERLLHYYNALPTADAETIPVGVETLSELETALNVDSGELGKLSDIIADMLPGDTVEADIHCMLSTGMQCLRFELHCDSSNGEHVFGCIRDCSDEERLRRNAISEAEYVEEMQPSCEFIIHVNMTRDTWKLLYARREGRITEMVPKDGTKRHFDEDIQAFVRDYCSLEDYDGFMDTMTCEALKRAYYEGKNEFSVDYRVSTKANSEKKWYRIIIRVWQDANNHHLKGDIFIIDINEQKKAEVERHERANILSRSLTAVGSMYFGLFYLDIVSGMVYAAKPFRGQPDNKIVIPYKEMIDNYFNIYVHPDDREKVCEILDPWYIRKTMVENTHLLQLRYRSLMGDVFYWSTLSVQAAQFENGTITKVVIALQHQHDVDTSRLEAKDAE